MESEVGIKRGCTRGSSARKCTQRIWAALKSAVPFPLVRRTVLLLHCIGSQADLRTLPRIVGGSYEPLYWRQGYLIVCRSHNPGRSQMVLGNYSDILLGLFYIDGT
jgi:hypothetical protein